MFNKLNDFYHNLKFQRKISLICLVSGLLPVLSLGIFCYEQIQTLLVNRENQALLETVKQASGTLENKLETYRNVISHIAWNDSIGQAVDHKYKNNHEMYITYRDTIDALFSTVCMLNRDIISVTLYTSTNLYPHGKTVRPIEEFKQLSLYTNGIYTKQPQFYVSSEDKTIVLYSSVLSNHSHTENYICMKLNYDKIFSQINSLFDNNFGFLILDSHGKSIYFYQKINNSILNLNVQEVISNIKSGKLKSKCLYTQQPLPKESWNLYLYRPLHSIYVNTRPITLTVIIIGLCCTALLYFLAYFLSKAVVRPLETLTKNMQQIEHGNLSLDLTPNLSQNDEIGVLVKQFRTMVQKLQYLINEVYKNKIASQKYEMKALQAQISPHFFYNSLSLINSKAIIAGQDDISSMAQLLSTFYRTTLNHGQSSISVREEWINTVSYVKIQLIMHSHSFEAIENLDPEIKEYIMPNLLLQPLVENAIVHGIDHKTTPGRGMLKITGAKENDQLMFTVEDNGCGISDKIMEHLLVKESKGYGVQNVHRRIQLLYGKDYGLSYKSEINKGTKTTLKIPAHNTALEADK